VKSGLEASSEVRSPNS